MQEVAEVRNHDVGTVCPQRIRLPEPVDAHDAAEVPRPSGFHPGDRVLEDGRFGGPRSDRTRPRQVGVRRRLSMQVLAVREPAVDDGVEELLDARRRRVPGGRCCSRRPPPRPCSLGVPRGRSRRSLRRSRRLRVRSSRSTISFLRVPRPWIVSAPGGSWGVPSSSSMPRAARKDAHPVVAGLAVHVALVVLDLVERDERLSTLLGPCSQEVVEHLLPGRRVDLRRLREDAVEIEQAGFHSFGQAEHPPNLPGHEAPQRAPRAREGPPRLPGAPDHPAPPGRAVGRRPPEASRRHQDRGGDGSAGLTTARDYRGSCSPCVEDASESIKPSRSRSSASLR